MIERQGGYTCLHMNVYVCRGDLYIYHLLRDSDHVKRNSYKLSNSESKGICMSTVFELVCVSRNCSLLDVLVRTNLMYTHIMSQQQSSLVL